MTRLLLTFAALGAGATLAMVPAVAAAQTRIDLRVEAVGTRRASGAEAAIGLRTLVSPYLRAEASVGGAFWHSAEPKLPSPRTEAAFRFLLDPINEQKWGLSFAGGLGYVDSPYLLVAADLEGQPMAGWRPAFRVALGGGTRIGLVLRRAIPNRR